MAQGHCTASFKAKFTEICPQFKANFFLPLHILFFFVQFGNSISASKGVIIIIFSGKQVKHFVIGPAGNTPVDVGRKQYLDLGQPFLTNAPRVSIDLEKKPKKVLN